MTPLRGDSDTVHVYPVADLVVHDTENGDACICGPHVEYVEGGGKLVTHHALDGREHQEPGHNRAECPLCSSSVATS